MKTNKIDDYLEELFPNPKCELNYNKDYELLIAIVLSAQSTDKRVNECTKVLFKKYKSLKALKEAEIRDLENIIRPVGSFHKKASYIKDIASILIDRYDGDVPTNRNELITLPGVGRKTINVFLSEFYNIPAIGVDTHVERVSKRLRLALDRDNVLIIEKKLMKYFKREDWAKRHLQMVLFGRYFCKAKKPLCRDCKLKDVCKEKRVS